MISYYLKTDVLPTKCIVLLVHGWLGMPYTTTIAEDVTTSNFVGKITYLTNTSIYINGLDFANCNYYAHTRIEALSITNYCLDYTLAGMRVLAGLVV